MEHISSNGDVYEQHHRARSTEQQVLVSSDDDVHHPCSDDNIVVDDFDRLTERAASTIQVDDYMITSLDAFLWQWGNNNNDDDSLDSFDNDRQTLPTSVPADEPGLVAQSPQRDHHDHHNQTQTQPLLEPPPATATTTTTTTTAPATYETMTDLLQQQEPIQQLQAQNLQNQVRQRQEQVVEQIAQPINVAVNAPPLLLPTDDSVCFGIIHHHATRIWRDVIRIFSDDDDNYPRWSMDVFRQVLERLAQQGIHNFFILRNSNDRRAVRRLRLGDDWRLASHNEIVLRTRQRFSDNRKGRRGGQRTRLGMAARQARDVAANGPNDNGGIGGTHHMGGGIQPLAHSTLLASWAAKFVNLPWTTELLRTMDNLTAFQFGAFMTSDPDPTASQFVQQTTRKLLLESKRKVEPTTTSSSSSPVITFVDLANETEKQQLQAEIDSMVLEISNRFQIPADAAALLLYEFRFDVDQATQSTFADFQGTIDRLGLSFRCTRTRKAPYTKDSLRSCSICFIDIDDGCAPLFSLPCQHDFCLDCWKGYITSQIGMTQILTTRCPSSGCVERFTFDDALQIDPGFFKSWLEAYFKAFVEHSGGRRRYCPGPNCSMIAMVHPNHASNNLCMSATCTKCKTCFCMKCGETKHAPAKCEDLDPFYSKLGSSSLWIKKNTKPCPGCRAAVEKDGGCNAMNCTRCRAGFCWECLSLVNAHSKHECVKFVPEFSADESQFELYATRFQTHQEAEDRLRKRLKDCHQRNAKVVLAVKTGIVLQDEDTDMFCTALETLIDTHNFLKNFCIASYANNSNLTLDSHQVEFETSTNELTHLTELDLEPFNERQIRRHFGMLGLHTLHVASGLNKMRSMVK